MPKMDAVQADKPIPNNHLGMIETVKVVREMTPLTTGPDGYHSIGAFIDEHLHNAIKSGVELQSITLHLADEKWGDIVRFYGG